MPDRKSWHISTGHGHYELEVNLGTVHTSSSGRNNENNLFFLLTSFKRRDPKVMPALLDAYCALSGRSLKQSTQTAMSTTDLERIANELRFHARSGKLHVTSIAPLKNLFVRDVPPEAKETVQAEADEEVTPTTVDTSWFEVVLKDEIDGLISEANIEFTVGDTIKSIPTDTNGVARYTGGTASEAKAVIKYPDATAIPVPETKTTWFEITVVDEAGKPIPGTKAVFYIGNKSYVVPCDASTGKARLENVEGEKALVKVLYPQGEKAMTNG